MEMKTAQLCLDFDSFLMNYDSLYRVGDKWIMRYGNETFDYVQEVEKRGLTEREECFRRWREVYGNLLTEKFNEVCRPRCVTESYPFTAILNRDTMGLHEHMSRVTENESEKLGHLNFKFLQIIPNLASMSAKWSEEFTYPMGAFLSHLGGILSLWIDLSLLKLLLTVMALVVSVVVKFWKEKREVEIHPPQQAEECDDSLCTLIVSSSSFTDNQVI